MIALYRELAIVRCPECDLVFYAGQIPEAGLYGNGYFAGGEYRDYPGDRRILERNFRAQIAFLRKTAPEGRLLEIGSAYGFFLELARSYWSVVGIDVSEEAVRYARETFGISVVLDDFLNLADQPESFDLICLWDTIEHLPHPVRTIEKAARWLKPGGSIVMTTGDIGSLNARWRKSRWRQIHPPTHLFYFSRKTLSRTVERAGLEIRSVTSVGYWRSLQSMLYGVLVLGRKRATAIYDFLTVGGRLDLPVYFNLHDILRMVASRPVNAHRGSRGGG